MVPIVLDMDKVRLAVVGNGPQALGRLEMLRRHGAFPQAVFAPSAQSDLRVAAGDQLQDRWPGADDLAQIDVVFAGDLSAQQADTLRQLAREAKVLLNTEDLRSHCDFHVPASVRRGDLLLTVSTGGGSPGLARRIARKLGELFGPEWRERLIELCRLREDWRGAGLDVPALKEKTDQYIDQKGWLS